MFGYAVSKFHYSIEDDDDDDDDVNDVYPIAYVSSRFVFTLNKIFLKLFSSFSWHDILTHVEKFRYNNVHC